MSDADAFDRVFALLAVAGDVRGCKARLARLKKLEERSAAAQAKLDADSASFEATKAELEAREAAVKDREERVDAAEMALIKEQPADRYPLSANLEPGGRSYSGLSREPYRS